MFDDWMQKYEYLIDLGKDLPSIDEKYRVEKKPYKGLSKQGLVTFIEENNGNIIFSADSDAIMTKGIVALLIRVLSGQNANDIVYADLDFINKIGLKEQLFYTRANGLLSMIKQMKLYGTAIDK